MLPNSEYQKNDIIDTKEFNLQYFDKIGDDGQIFFDSLSIIPGHNIVVNCIKTSHERLQFMKSSKPKHIIQFDPQLSLTREILLFQAYCKAKSIKCSVSEIHIIMVQNSIESAIYLNQIQRENEAFITLVKERSALGIEENTPQMKIKNQEKAKLESTRAGKGMNLNLTTKPIVLVDKREFNSQLPSRLFHDGFWIVPIQLERGDYILSNDICVERKSVETGDLLASLRSGRLESQLTHMCAIFTKPILLIEFSDTIDFNLNTAELTKNQQNSSWIDSYDFDKRELFKADLKYNLAVLCTKFPRLNLIWSKSAEFTSKIFKSLKDKCADPDPKIFGKFQEIKEKEGGTDANIVGEKLESEEQAMEDIENLIGNL